MRAQARIVVGVLVIMRSSLLHAMDGQQVKLRKAIKEHIHQIVIVKSEVEKAEITRLAHHDKELKKDLKNLYDSLKNVPSHLKLAEFCTKWKVKPIALPQSTSSPVVGARRALRVSDKNLITEVPEVPFRLIDDNELYVNGEGMLE